MRTSFSPKNNPRVIIIQKLYGKYFNDDQQLTFPKHRFKKFIKDIVLGTIERNDLILDELNKNLGEEFTLNKLDKLFQVILRSATFEFLYKPNLSINIIIKEYLNASNFFLNDSQTKYLNALLDVIAKRLRSWMDEFQLIRKYFSKLSKNNKSALNLNDDVFFDKSKKLVISVDTYVEGTHFLNFEKPELVIKKIIRSSISDLICKGVKPKFYFISGSGNKKSFSSNNLRRIAKSLKQEQKKYNISLCGGDTVFSDKLSFTIISFGFSNKIILRNNVKLNDDIYVTGNLGDSFVGLNILKKRFKLNQKLNKYFILKYYMPNLHLKLIDDLFFFANSSIDISDGLVSDLEKLINKQKFSYKLDLASIPVSENLKKLISLKGLNKKNFISQGDDYQILFTANSTKSRIIKKISNSLGIKISKIGKICSHLDNNEIIDQKGMKISLKNKGYIHKF